MNKPTSSRSSKLLQMLELVAFVAFVGVNAIALLQARAMTHYVTVDSSARRTQKPEQLSLSEKIGVVLTGVTLPRPTNQMTPEAIDLPYDRQVIPVTSNENLPADSQVEQIEAWFIPASVPFQPLAKATSTKAIVLLFPPYGGSKSSLLAPAQAFHELGYDTFLVDYRGVGGSTGSETGLGVREAQDVARSTAYVQQKWANRPIILYGASMGAAAVMRAVAIEGVSPTAIILESPFDRLLNTVRHRFEAMGLPTFPSAELLVFWGSVLQQIDGFGHNPVEYAKQISCPVLLMYGDRDQRVKLSEIQNIFESLSQDKQLIIFNAVGHGSLAADDATKWKSSVSQFLQN